MPDRTDAGRPMLRLRELTKRYRGQDRPAVDRLSLDVAAIHRGRSAATTDNDVFIPSRERFDIGGRYRFKLGGKDATLRMQMINVFDRRNFNTAGPGIYAPNAPRFVTGYLAIDM